jgi:tRNA pseudouridine55 synthase
VKDFGLLIVDKPIGPTSHRVVSIVRQGTRIRKVGHAGTLDPRASGVLVLCLGNATRLSEYLSASVKGYSATIRFGASTRTYDGDGEVVRRTDRSPSRSELDALLPTFRGKITQVPPPFSAIKLQGRKAYELARRGEEVDLQPREVTVHALEVTDYSPPDLSLNLECSAGTYVRSIAHDLGEKLGTGAYLVSLRRTKSGPFTLADAVGLDTVEAILLMEPAEDRLREWERLVIPAECALPELLSVMLDSDAVQSLRNGHCIAAEPPSQGMAKAIGPDGELVAILQAADEGRSWHPHKVLRGG